VRRSSNQIKPKTKTMAMAMVKSKEVESERSSAEMTDAALNWIN